MKNRRSILHGQKIFSIANNKVSLWKIRLKMNNNVLLYFFFWAAAAAGHALLVLPSTGPAA